MYQIEITNTDQPVVVITHPDELCEYTEPETAFAVISGWIDDFNKQQQETNNGQGTMLERPPQQLIATVAAGMGVVVLEWNGAGYVPACFCALYDAPEGTPLPAGHLEFGTLIRAPHTTVRGLGRLATIATLALPAAQAATTVYAYANHNSLPVLTHGCEREVGIAGTIVPEAELEAAGLSYLTPYAGDTVVDLTYVKAVVGVKR